MVFWRLHRTFKSPAGTYQAQHEVILNKAKGVVDGIVSSGATRSKATVSGCISALHTSVSCAIQMVEAFTQPFYQEREMQGSIAPHSVTQINSSLTPEAGTLGKSPSLNYAGRQQDS